MGLVRWKDLCIDATGPDRVSRFWSAALGRERELQEGGDAVLRGAVPAQTVWVNQVPEAKTVKNRVHLDLVAPDVQPLLEAGATRSGEFGYDGHEWTVLLDPEGGELCVFSDPREPTALVVDSNDSVADAAWWAELLGGTPTTAPGGLPRWVSGVPGLPFDVLKFVGVPEPKTVKNRVHWDVTGRVEDVVARGARVLADPHGQARWHVLADPAGNEFCVFAP
ncbi:VOC family protein [Motilibacter deserti]|uniref:VOC family protein n=1 Tax=Motilibacter deserti TaxID=2714956 RepID=A0ABX0GUH8_9ACTN|nr:VOC family protein [Motilibacter deserti]NHC13366.1 VOC family protein [Motilibacter deserti]